MNQWIYVRVAHSTIVGALPESFVVDEFSLVEPVEAVGQGVSRRSRRGCRRNRRCLLRRAVRCSELTRSGWIQPVVAPPACSDRDRIILVNHESANSSTVKHGSHTQNSAPQSSNQSKRSEKPHPPTHLNRQPQPNRLRNPPTPKHSQRHNHHNHPVQKTGSGS